MLSTTSVWLPRIGVEAAADVQQGHIGPGQPAELRQRFAADRGIVGVDAGDLVGMGGGPGVGVAPPRLMPMKAGFLDSPCFSVRKAYQASHCLPARTR